MEVIMICSISAAIIDNHDLILMTTVCGLIIALNNYVRLNIKKKLLDINKSLVVFNEVFMSVNGEDVLGDFKFEKGETRVDPVVILEQDFDKGYDLFYANRKKGESEPKHMHGRAKELFILLNGKMKINQYDENKRYVTSIILDDKISTWLVRNKIYHTIEYLEDCEFLVIAHPPIFTRIGRIYDRAIRTIKSAFNKT
jgi:hypothetical protein